MNFFWQSGSHDKSFLFMTKCKTKSVCFLEPFSEFLLQKSWGETVFFSHRVFCILWQSNYFHTSPQKNSPVKCQIMSGTLQHCSTIAWDTGLLYNYSTFLQVKVVIFHTGLYFAFSIWTTFKIPSLCGSCVT